MMPERRTWAQPINGLGYDQETGEYDCTKCGACCAPFSKPVAIRHYVRLLPEDLENPQRMEVLGEISGETRLWGQCVRTCRGVNGTQCIALRGVVGEGAYCSVYEDRPEACRRFAPGSDACLELREEHLSRRIP